MAKKKHKQRDQQGKQAVLERIKLNAAGIDIGSESLFIAVLDKPVMKFTTFTDGLKQAVGYLKECGVTSVAVEATGIYWFPVYEFLEQAGIEIYVVNGRHVKNVPGRKTDVLDSEWLRELHTYGLLRSSFVPKDSIRKLRYYVRLRNDHVTMGASHIQHVQKNLDAMNIKLHTVISDIMGESGLKILRAILAGERNPEALLQLCHITIREKKGDNVIKSLEGNYREEYLFGLRQALEMWEVYQRKMFDCDKEIEKLLKEMTQENLPMPESSNPKVIRHNRPEINDLHLLMMKLTQGKDPTQIAGINDYTLMQLISETGTDLGNWPSSDHFTSWLGLAPSQNKSGKQNKTGKRKRRKVNRAGCIFKQIAMNVGNGKNSALSGFYKRIKSRSGAPTANKATARKIAVYYYNLMTRGFSFVEEGLKRYEERYKEQQLKSLQKRAKEMGLQLVVA
jgi:transposase